MNPQYMGQDKVFVFLFENFYAKGDTTLLDASNKKTITERAYNLMANQIGLPAPPMDFVDTAGRPAPLYGLKSKFTVVAFWDPTCGHCKIEIPRLDSIYRAKWKAMGVSIYAVNINEPETKAWKNFIVDNKLAGWVHTFAVSSSRRMSAPGDAAEGKPFAAEAALKAVVARKAMSRQWKAMTGDSVGNTMAVCRS